MTRLFATSALVSMLLYACASKPKTPEFTAKAFVQDYFFSQDRSTLLKNTADAAEKKLTAESSYFERLHENRSEIDRPASVSLIGYEPIGENVFQYTFTIQYQGSFTHSESMIVTLTLDSGLWIVSDYHFKQKGE